MDFFQVIGHFYTLLYDLFKILVVKMKRQSIQFHIFIHKIVSQLGKYNIYKYILMKCWKCYNKQLTMIWNHDNHQTYITMSNVWIVFHKYLQLFSFSLCWAIHWNNIINIKCSSWDRQKIMEKAEAVSKDRD